jgi:hypothetical protein
MQQIINFSSGKKKKSLVYAGVAQLAAQLTCNQ